MKRVLITGAKGQLGRCLEVVSEQFPKFDCTFVSKSELDISNIASIAEIFRKDTYDYCINTAAYTNVELAETEKEIAFSINAEGVKNIAEACKKNGVALLHISTDYVFDGTKKMPYAEVDETNPINAYGASKLQGEQYISETCEAYYILRTSWLYSNFGKNFYTSMLRLAAEKRELSITTAEVGTPTNAYDLAKICFQIISEEKIPFGTYHFSNQGEATWYDFAKEIFNLNGVLDRVQLSKTSFYPTKAMRPTYSVLSTKKINTELDKDILDWRVSLNNLIESTKK